MALAQLDSLFLVFLISKFLWGYFFPFGYILKNLKTLWRHDAVLGLGAEQWGRWRGSEKNEGGLGF